MYDLIFFVGQCLGWCDSDGVIGMDVYCIKVFDRVDDDVVVVFIMYYFYFVFFLVDQ